MEAVLPKHKKIEIIQVLRGIAALGIVYFHTEYGPWRSANWGVDFFFILSGYFFMVSTERFVNGRAAGYWKSKIIKICPEYYTMTIVVSLAWLVFPSFFRTTVVNAETLVKSFLFLPCYGENGRIFPVYSIGWTLNLEMFFYIMGYISLKLSYRYRGAILSGVFGLLVAFGLLFSPEQAMLKFWTQTRSITFIVGIAAYEIEKHFPSKKKCTKKIGFPVLALGLAMLFSGHYIIGDSSLDMWNFFWGGVLLFDSLYCLKNLPCNKLLVALGDMSYSIYLTHFLVVGLMCRVLIDNTSITLLNSLLVIITVALAVVCSWITYQIFEKKLALWIKSFRYRGKAGQ